MNPKVSVIIPTYNRAKMLKKCLGSVLSQSFQNFEIIISDDGSTDNTKEIVKNYQTQDDRIKYIWQENSGNPTKPRNKGIKEARGEFIAFLDSDDEWLPKKLEKQIALFQKNKKSNIGIVACNVLTFNVDNKKIKKYKIPNYKNAFKELLARNFIFGSASMVMIKKEVFDEVGLFNENISSLEDWEMWLRITKKYDFDKVEDYLCCLTVHNGNRGKDTSQKLLEKEKDLQVILNRYKKYYEKYPAIKSRLLRYEGTKYILADNLKIGRQKLIKSIKKNPLNIKSYFYLLFSLFGNKFYNFLAQVKRIIKNLIK